MADRKHRHLTAENLVYHGIRKVLEVVALRSVLIFRPISSRFGKAVDCLEDLDAEGIRRQRASFEVPEKRRARTSASASGRMPIANRLTVS